MRRRFVSSLFAAVLSIADPAVAGGKAAPIVGPWGHGADGEAERFLLDARIVEARDLGTGVTHPRKVTLELDGRTAFGVWKGIDVESTSPSSTKTRPDDLFFSDRWQHEVAAYRLARLLGLTLVPPTVAREIDGAPGSLQEWVENAFTERKRVEEGRALTDAAAYGASSQHMYAFDALIYNVDRTQENILITEPGSRLWLIDHSRAFRLTHRLPTLGGRGPLVVPEDMLPALRTLDVEAVRSALRGLLSEGQISGLLARRERLLGLSPAGHAAGAPRGAAAGSPFATPASMSPLHAPTTPEMPRSGP